MLSVNDRFFDGFSALRMPTSPEPKGYDRCAPIDRYRAWALGVYGIGIFVFISPFYRYNSFVLGVYL